VIIRFESKSKTKRPHYFTFSSRAERDRKI